MKKGIVVVLIAAMICISLAGCGTSQESRTDKAILVVSFGTSYNNSRNITIGGIESAIRENYPDYEVRRAFTAQTIIDILQERDGIDIDNVEEALDKLVEEGYTTLIVQPTHLMHGYEYDDLVEVVGEYEDKFDSIAIGEPLLTSDEDLEAVIESITTRTTSYDDGDTAIIFMGHGTEHEANSIYTTLQEKITADGYENYYIGTVEATPSLEDMVAYAKAGGYSKVVLEDLMVVAGDHANNDMAGDDADSWKSTFEAEGFEVVCILQGLGQFNEIQDLYVQHVQDAIDSL
jgi:sirohydrochlorin cobaltochelatase